MTATVASMGWATKLGMGEETTYGTGVAANRQYVFISESIAKQGVIVERDGLRGTRSRQSDDTRVGPYTVGGQIVLEPNPEDLAVLLPWILGTDAAATTFALADTLQPFTTVVDRVAKVFTYAGCMVDRATFSGQSGGLMRLALDIVAQSESVGAAGSFPSLTAAITTPYIFSDLTLTLAASARECSSFELVIDNQLEKGRFMNSTTIINSPPQDRIITLTTTHPYAAGTGTTGTTDLYGQALAGAAGTLAMATGNYSTSFAFATLQVPDHSPTTGGRGEIPLTLNMVARKSSTTNELIVTHDSTP